MAKVNLLNKIFLTLIFFSNFIFGQKELSQWYFGAQAGLDFLSTPPAILMNSSMRAPEGSVSIADSSGNLLFYTKGDTIWNKLHQVMQNGMGLLGDQSTSQSAIIIKDPGNTLNYYVFTLDQLAQPNGLHYSVVDMSLASGNGSVTLKNVSVYADSCSERLAATRHCNGTDVWILIHEFGSNNFRSYLLTSTGFNTVAVISSVGTIHSNSNWSGCMKISPNSKKLAVATYDIPGPIELFDFDNYTGIVSNPFTVGTINKAYGCEFSPDGSKLYASGINGNALYQWDLCAGSNSQIALSQYTVSGTSLFQIQRAIDNKIYVARFNQQSIGVINNPNLAGNLCNYVDAGQSIAPKGSLSGLPNFLYDVFTGLPKVFTYTVNTSLGCQTLMFSPMNISLVNTSCSATGSNYNGLKWIFGDPASGSANTSTLSNPTHAFSGAGIYTVKLIINGNCAIDTLIQHITIPSNPVLNVSANTTICAGETVTLSASGGDIYVWSTGSSNANIVVQPLMSKQYTVTSTNTLTGCISKSVVNVYVNTCTELNEKEQSKNGLKIYPNPNPGIFKIESASNIHFKLCQQDGSVIFVKEIQKGENTINISELTDGVYFIKYFNDETICILKLIKLKQD